MKRPAFVTMVAMLLLATMGVGTALAGEVTGNGKNLWTATHQVNGEVHHELHGNSLCAFSGQEDAQFYDEVSGEPLDEGDIVKGEPAHAQSWGQIPKAFRDFLTAEGEHPGMACNPTRAGQHP